MLRLEKEVRKRLSRRVHDVVEEYLSGVQARPVSSDFPPLGPTRYLTESCFDSTGQRNTFVEHFCWATEGQRLSRAIDRVRGDLGLSDVINCRALVSRYLLKSHS
jgi:hypothetical protein